jgi:lipopolysaccharide export system permease protein
MPPETLFKYIALRAIIGVGGLLVILASLVLLIDLIENLRFVSKLSDGSFGLAVTLTLLRAPALTQALIPFVFLFGSIWMFHQLNRRSELSVMRSAGLSIWRLLGPAAFIAALVGVLIITVLDPMSSTLLSYAEQVKTRVQGKPDDVVRLFEDGIWLRQRDEARQIIVNAKTLDAQNGALGQVTVWRFGPGNQFLERIDADEAMMSGATMEMRDARLTSISDQRQLRTPVYAINTALTVNDLSNRVVPPETMSLWQLPRYILMAEAAGLPTARYHIRFHDLSSTPLKLLAMVLIAAAFSLRPTRLGGALQLIAASVGAGFLLYILSEISTALGESELAPAALAAWTPAVVAALAAITALLHMEDG